MAGLGGFLQEQQTLGAKELGQNSFLLASGFHSGPFSHHGYLHNAVGTWGTVHGDRGQGPSICTPAGSRSEAHRCAASLSNREFRQARPVLPTSPRVR